MWQPEHRVVRNWVLPFAILPLDPLLDELDELLDEELLEDELVEDVLLDEELLDELLLVGVPDEVFAPPHPTRRIHAASAPPVRLSILLIADILFSTSGCWFYSWPDSSIPVGNLVARRLARSSLQFSCRVLRLFRAP